MSKKGRPAAQPETAAYSTKTAPIAGSGPAQACAAETAGEPSPEVEGRGKIAFWENKPVGLDIVLLLLLPLLAAVRNIDYLFSQAGYLDSWIYNSFFRHPSELTSLFPGTYYGSRLGWILPGSLAYHILPALTANFLLHSCVLYTATFSLYVLMRELFGRRTALISASYFALYPFTWIAMGTDYVDGAAIAYYLLCAALTVRYCRTSKVLNLFLAGCAFALMIYTQLFCIVLASSILILYLACLPRITLPSAVSAAMRFAAIYLAALAIVTVALGLFSRYLGGQFWFYVPSLKIGNTIALQPSPWRLRDYAWLRQAFWLPLPAIAFISSASALLRRAVGRRTRPIALALAANVVLTSALMLYFQLKSAPVLQIYYYASYLIPVVFPWICALCFADLETASKGWWGAVAASVACAAATWLSTHPTGSAVLLSSSALWVFVYTCALFGIVITFLPGRFRVGVGLIAIPMLILVCKLSGTGGMVSPKQAAAFKRITSASGYIEQQRKDNSLRFWYSSKDPNSADFDSINSCYLWAYTYINRDFPALDASVNLPEGTLIALLSSQPTAPDLVRKGFAERKKVLEVVDRREIHDGVADYYINLVRVSRDPVSLIPLELDAGSVLRAAGDGAAHPLSPEKWIMADYKGEGNLTRVNDGVRVQTASNHWAYGSLYPLISVGDAGEYLFVLKYQLVVGDMNIGALKGDMSQWISQAGPPVHSGSVLTKEFSLRLKAGESIRVITENNRATENRPSEFVIRSVSAYRVKDDHAVR